MPNQLINTRGSFGEAITVCDEFGNPLTTISNGDKVVISHENGKLVPSPFIDKERPEVLIVDDSTDLIRRIGHSLHGGSPRFLGDTHLTAQPSHREMIRDHYKKMWQSFVTNLFVPDIPAEPQKPNLTDETQHLVQFLWEWQEMRHPRNWRAESTGTMYDLMTMRNKSLLVNSMFGDIGAYRNQLTLGEARKRTLPVPVRGQIPIRFDVRSFIKRIKEGWAHVHMFSKFFPEPKPPAKNTSTFYKKFL